MGEETGFDGVRHRYNPNATQMIGRPQIGGYHVPLFVSTHPPRARVPATLINNAARDLGDWPKAPRFSSLPQYLASTRKGATAVRARYQSVRPTNHQTGA